MAPFTRYFVFFCLNQIFLVKVRNAKDFSSVLIFILKAPTLIIAVKQICLIELVYCVIIYITDFKHNLHRLIMF